MEDGDVPAHNVRDGKMGWRNDLPEERDGTLSKGRDVSGPETEADGVVTISLSLLINTQRNVFAYCAENMAEHGS